jgi:hypothetical protein
MVDVEANRYASYELGVGVQVDGMDCGVNVQEGITSFAGTVGGGKGFTAAYGLR